MRVVIVGAGIAGFATALALTKWLPERPQITVIELRSSPSSMGGAIGLTPNAVRALATLGVLQHIKQRELGIEVEKIELFDIYSASSLGIITFTGADGNGLGAPPFKGLRILRSGLLNALLDEVTRQTNVTLEYGRKIIRITENNDEVVAEIDGRWSTLSADLLIGADGIHSFVRRHHVEPERAPEYTGIAAVGGFADVASGAAPLRWKDTALGQALRGSLLCSYYESTRTKQFVAAVMETPDVKSKDGWIAMGKEQDEIKQRVEERYLGDGLRMTGIAELVKAGHSWNLWPVYSLSGGGRWTTERAVLVGDAAHAVGRYHTFPEIAHGLTKPGRCHHKERARESRWKMPLFLVESWPMQILLASGGA
jgi:salicylate hydroxylase